MCFRNKLTETLKSRPPRSPHRRHYREPIKPRLSRKVVPSAKVNLNAYWSQFEKLSMQSSSILTFDLPNVMDLSSTATFPNHEGSEIDDNLINELMELVNK